MNTVANIEFALAVIDPVVDELAARLDAAGFPVLEANLETAVIRVDASFDPDDYSVLMAATEAAIAVGISEENVIFAEVINS